MDTLITNVITKKELVSAFQNIGVGKGMVIELHCAMSKCGYIVGGAQCFVDALIETVGIEGTIVVPYQNANNSEPGYWQYPPIERRLWSKIRDYTPAFSQEESDVTGMSEVYINLARRPGSYCSDHPNCAFVAYGKYAKLITQRDNYDFPLAQNGPLGKMYNLPTKTLLVGTDYDTMTSLHLAEAKSEVRSIILQGGAVNKDGYRSWVKFLDYDVDCDEFKNIGTLMEEKHLVAASTIGQAKAKFIDYKEAVDFATEYLRNKYIK